MKCYNASLNISKSLSKKRNCKDYYYAEVGVADSLWNIAKVLEKIMIKRWYGRNAMKLSLRWERS